MTAGLACSGLFADSLSYRIPQLVDPKIPHFVQVALEDSLNTVFITRQISIAPLFFVLVKCLDC